MTTTSAAEPARRYEPTLTTRRYWYPLVALTRREIHKRYASSVLGLTWTVLQPLVLIGVYTFVFGLVLGPRDSAESSQRFALFLLAGLLPYLSIVDGLQGAVLSLREDRALFDRDTFPGAVIPFSRVLSASTTEVAGLCLLIGLTAALTGRVSAWLVLLPVLVCCRIALTAGLAWIVSVLSVFVADLAQALSLLLTAWLFLTPIFYAADALPASLGWLLAINPLHHLIAAYRAVLIDGQGPGISGVVIALWSVALAAGGLAFFNKALSRARDLL